MKKLLKSRECSLLAVMALLCVVVSISSPAFMQGNNLTNILNNSIPMIILGCGMTMVIIIGGIDVAVGAEMICSSYVAGSVALSSTGNIFLCVLAAMGVGLLMGLFNGVLIAHLNVPPFIATIGTLNIFRGGLLFTTQSQWLMNLPEFITDITRKKFLGVPYSVFIMLILVVVTWWLLKYTRFGRAVYAIGGNREAAVRAGIQVRKTQLLVYTYTGLMTGFAGLLNAARLGNIQPGGSLGIEMTVVAAVILGGTSIQGGVGSPVGTVFGVIMMTIFENLLVLLYVPTYWQKFFEGTLMITIIILGVMQNALGNRGKVRIDVETDIRAMEVKP
ncbi:MAG: ABC transporter permease [Clostridia bacterium]